MSSYWGELEKIASSREATEALNRLEKELSSKLGLVDMGEHHIMVTRIPK
jgi:hypothetical protein